MRIALLGYGIEGESAHQYLARRHPDAAFAVYDQREERPETLPSEVQFIGGVTHFHGITADLVVRTPAIAPDRVSATGEVTSVTKLFFADCPAHIIGVTGSKGKGTTASFIASILRLAGKTVHLVGNIGIGALDALPEITPGDIVVYELSSYQLWDLEVSPPTAVVLMIEPDHLDVHSGMEDYVMAKSAIAKHQKPEDRLVFYAQNEYSRRIAELSPALKFAYPDEGGFHIKNGSFYIGAQKICSISVVNLPGVHNLDNALAAVAAVWTWVDEGEVIAKGLADFHGLPHRLAFVAEKHGVKYYDDSIATTPGSAVAALRAFEQPKVLILGGVSKGADFSDLAEELLQHAIRKVLLIGREAKNIAATLQAANFHDYEIIEEKTMSSIVHRAASIAKAGDAVLLSPACASFDMFESYQDRGEQFSVAVMELPK